MTVADPSSRRNHCPGFAAVSPFGARPRWKQPDGAAALKKASIRLPSLSNPSFRGGQVEFNRFAVHDGSKMISTRPAGIFVGVGWL